MQNSINQLRKQAFEIRKSVLESLALAGSGHTGGSLGLADVFTALYFKELTHQPDNPKWTNRDRLVLSIGHVAPVYYATLAHAGYFPVEELKTLRKLGSRLQGHPGRDHNLPGLESSSGSLGHGLSIALGMAIAAQQNQKKHRIFSIHGDGELQEGSIWEAAMAAGSHKMENMVAIVDRNFLQIDGETETVMQLEPLADKWKAFNWDVFECNGNDMESILKAFEQIKKVKGKPKVLIAKTKMGAGVPSIENNHLWHGKPPGPEQVREFVNELEENTEK